MTTQGKLLLWKNELLPGSETFIRHQAEAVDRWEVTVAGMEKVPSALSQDSDVVLFGSSRTDKALRRLLTLTGVSPRVTRFVARQNPDIVHAQFATSGWTVLRACKKARIPLVVSVLGNDLMRLPRAPGIKGIYNRWRLRKVLDYATTVVAISATLEEAARELTSDQSKVIRHYIGVPQPSPNPADHTSTGQSFDAVVVGRLVEKKGIAYLIQAWRTVASAGDFRLAIIGDGPLMQDLRAQAQPLGDAIVFMGQQSESDTLALVEQASIIVAPSVTARDGDAEGLPTILVQAARLNTPAVATKHAGIPEIVQDGKTGILVEERDSESLAHAIITLLEQPEVAVKMGTAACLFAQENFDIGKQMDALQKIYERIASTK